MLYITGEQRTFFCCATFLPEDLFIRPNRTALPVMPRLTVSVPPTREELVKFSAAKGGGAVGKDKKGRKGSSDSAPKLKDKGGRTVGSGEMASTVGFDSC